MGIVSEVRDNNYSQREIMQDIAIDLCSGTEKNGHRSRRAVNIEVTFTKMRLVFILPLVLSQQYMNWLLWASLHNVYACTYRHPTMMV